MTPTSGTPTKLPTFTDCPYLLVTANDIELTYLNGEYTQMGTNLNNYYWESSKYRIKYVDSYQGYWQINNTQTNNITESLVERTGYNLWKPPQNGNWSYYMIRNEPTQNPTISPSFSPSSSPTQPPSSSPTPSPSISPTNNPSNIPTRIPSYMPTMEPTLNPSVSRRRRLQPMGLQFYGQLYDITMICGSTKTPTTAMPSTTPSYSPTRNCISIYIITNNFMYNGLYERYNNYLINNNPYWESPIHKTRIIFQKNRWVIVKKNNNGKYLEYLISNDNSPIFIRNAPQNSLWKYLNGNNQTLTFRCGSSISPSNDPTFNPSMQPTQYIKPKFKDVCPKNYFTFITNENDNVIKYDIPNLSNIIVGTFLIKNG